MHDGQAALLVWAAVSVWYMVYLCASVCKVVAAHRCRGYSKCFLLGGSLGKHWKPLLSSAAMGGVYYVSVGVPL
jgi:hypothetical protein